MRNRSLLPVVMMLSFLLASQVLAADSQVFGNYHPKAPAEIAQYDFMKGQWDLTVTHFRPDGTETKNKATFTGKWIVEGFVFQQDFKSAYIAGSEFRAWDPTNKKWVGHNIYAGSLWRDVEAEFIDGKMIVLISAWNARLGSFLNRETYSEIEKDSFVVRSERSFDEGKTWERGAYAIEASRADAVR